MILKELNLNYGVYELTNSKNKEIWPYEDLVIDNVQVDLVSAKGKYISWGITMEGLDIYLVAFIFEEPNDDRIIPENAKSIVRIQMWDEFPHHKEIPIAFDDLVNLFVKEEYESERMIALLAAMTKVELVRQGDHWTNKRDEVEVEVEILEGEGNVLITLNIMGRQIKTDDIPIAVFEKIFEY